MEKRRSRNPLSKSGEASPKVLQRLAAIRVEHLHVVVA